MTGSPCSSAPSTGTLYSKALLVVALLFLQSAVIAQEEEQAPPENEPPAVAVEEPAPLAVSWSDRVDRLIEQKFLFEKDSEDADNLFRELDRALHDRIHRINDRMRSASSPWQPVNLDKRLPVSIHSIADLHENINELYAARLRLLEHLSDELQLEVTATDVIGVEQLKLELELIWEQIQFRTLYLPAAMDDLVRRIQIAPLPVVWHFIKLLLVVAVFRWWRRWLPETMRRMQSSLADIRPRSPAVMRRIRFIWYVEQVRRPLEWMLVMTIVFSMLRLDGLNLLLAIAETIVQWILLGWLAVSVLNAFAARGAAGLTGADESVRLRSLRLIAAWLVLLGLGLNLAEDLTGVATLHAWVWRLFQILALPVLLILLAWWRQPIFMRLEREKENSETVQQMLEHQKGLRSFGAAANGAFWLLANRLRRALMRTFLRVGDTSSLSLTGAPVATNNESAVEAQSSISSEVLPVLLAGSSGYEKHARTERRRLIRRANSEQPGIVAIVGERGIGKGALLQELANALPDAVVRLDCNNGQFAELEDAFRQQLSISSASPGAISEAMRQHEIKMVTVKNVHRLSRPIAGGQGQLKQLTDLIEAIDQPMLWVMSIDCFTWQFLRRVRADQSSIHEAVDMPAWTEDQLSALIEQRTLDAELEPDFSRVQVPPEHAVTSYDTLEERNKAGVYRMIWTLSAGNPEVALLTWSNCLYRDEDERQVYVKVPASPSTRELDSAAHNVMLVLRCIAQSELVTQEDVVDNLRLPQGAVGTAMHYCISQGWINEDNGRYRIAMRWFRTITRTLARQNLLAR